MTHDNLDRVAHRQRRLLVTDMLVLLFFIAVLLVALVVSL